MYLYRSPSPALCPAPASRPPLRLRAFVASSCWVEIRLLLVLRETVSKLTERLEKAVDDLRFHLDERDLAAEFPVQAGHTEFLDTAGCDTVEPGQVRLHVQCEAVGGDPTRRKLDADGGDLALPHPHARVLGMVPTLEPVVSQNLDDDVFQLAQVGVGVAHLEAQNRVPHDL